MEVVWDIKSIMSGILVVVVSALVMASARTWLDMRSFMQAGDRCTSSECGSMVMRISHIEMQTATYQRYHEQGTDDMILEMRRLQQQIDRLEQTVFQGKKMPKLDPYADGDTSDDSVDG